MIRSDFSKGKNDKTNEKIINSSGKMLTISEDEKWQRIDNYLLAKLKGTQKFNLSHCA